MPFFKDHVMADAEGELPVAVLSGIEPTMEVKKKLGQQGSEHSCEKCEAMNMAQIGGQPHGDQIAEAMDGVEFTSSRPPTPLTPTLSRQPPARLTCMTPPRNYGAVVDYTIFRSSYPGAVNISFLESLRIHSVLTLVTKAEPCDEYADFLDEYFIRRKIVDIEPNKDGKVVSQHAVLCEAVIFAINPSHHPVYIHCNQGKHRTGCVVAIIRKLQKWPMDDIIAEYKVYAGDKVRDGDIDLIKNFDADSVFQYAKKNFLLEGFERRSDSVSESHDMAADLIGFEGIASQAVSENGSTDCDF